MHFPAHGSTGVYVRARRGGGGSGVFHSGAKPIARDLVKFRFSEEKKIPRGIIDERKRFPHSTVGEIIDWLFLSCHRYH